MPAALHILNNGIEQVTEHMEHFHEWYQMLNALVVFLNKPGWVGLFIKTCLTDSNPSHDAFAALLRAFNATLSKEGRFRKVIEAAKQVVPLMLGLVRHWDPYKFKFHRPPTHAGMGQAGGPQEDQVPQEVALEEVDLDDFKESLPLITKAGDATAL